MTKLYVEAKDAARPEDFDFEKLGMIPIAQTVPVQVDTLADNTSPAAVAGMKPGDKIMAVDGQHPRSVDALLAYLQDQAGKPAQVTVARLVDGKVTTANLTVAPTQGETKLGKAWMLGIKTVPPPVTVEQMDFGKALKASKVDNLKNSVLIFDVLHRLFTRQVSVKSLSSPVGMSVQVNEAFEQQGWFPIVATMAMISLNLGIFNLLPIPILDGGMITFLFIESLMRRDLNQQVKERVYQVAFRLPGVVCGGGDLQRHYEAAARACEELGCARAFAGVLLSPDCRYGRLVMATVRFSAARHNEKEQSDGDAESHQDENCCDHGPLPLHSVRLGAELSLPAQFPHDAGGDFAGAIDLRGAEADGTDAGVSAAAEAFADFGEVDEFAGGLIGPGVGADGDLGAGSWNG